jgi:hypothetical protein
MTDTLKVLAQSNPVANNLTDIYTVAGSTQATISSITISNLDSVQVNFWLSIAVAGAADTPKQYMYYNMILDTNDTFIATIGVTLAATDVIRVKASTANVAFNIFGVEIT